MLFSFLVLASLSAMVLVQRAVSENQMVHIDVNGKPLYILPLDRDNVVSVEGPLGRTSVEIKDRKVRIKDSPCNNKLCIRQDWNRSGSIICLPNRVLVTIENPEGQNPIVDAITG